MKQTEKRVKWAYEKIAKISWYGKSSNLIPTKASITLFINPTTSFKWVTQIYQNRIRITWEKKVKKSSWNPTPHARKLFLGWRKSNLQQDQEHLLACTWPMEHQCLDQQPFEQPTSYKLFQEHQFPIPQDHTRFQSVNSIIKHQIKHHLYSNWLKNFSVKKLKKTKNTKNYIHT